jgi:hypothetical protein
MLVCLLACCSGILKFVPKKKPTVKILGPEHAEARDEGPRLIPLGKPSTDQHSDKLQYYISLADIALRQK